MRSSRSWLRGPGSTLLAVSLLSFVLACGGPRGGVRLVAAPPPPPPLQVQPRPGQVYVAGHWEPHGDGWQWSEGYWVAQRPGYEWVDGEWVDAGGYWRWRAGHWVVLADRPGTPGL